MILVECVYIHVGATYAYTMLDVNHMRVVPVAVTSHHVSPYTRLPCA